jgi:hypothetical protein
LAQLTRSTWEQLREIFSGQRMAGAPASHGLTVEEAQRAGLDPTPTQAGVAPGPFTLAPRVGYGAAGALTAVGAKLAVDNPPPPGSAPSADLQPGPAARGLRSIFEKLPAWVQEQQEADRAAQAAAEGDVRSNPIAAAGRILRNEAVGTAPLVGAMAKAGLSALRGEDFGSAYNDALGSVPGAAMAEEAVREADRQAQEAGVPWWVRGGLQLLAPGGTGELVAGAGALFKITAKARPSRSALRALEDQLGHSVRPAGEIPVIPALAHGQGKLKGQVAIVGDSEYTTHPTLAKEAGYQSLARSGLVRGYIDKETGEFITFAQARTKFGRADATEFWLGEPLSGVRGARSGVATPAPAPEPPAAGPLAAGVREARGSGVPMASRPPGRAARLRSDIMASRTQPVVEPDDLVGTRSALGSRVDVRAATTQGEAIELANTGRHLKVGNDGGYVGAQWIKGPEALVRMRSNFDDLVDQGVKAGGEDWYMRTQDGIRLITRGEAQERRIGREWGATSRQRTPETNLDMGVGAHNAANVGDRPPKLYDEAGREGFIAESRGTGQVSGGPKLDPYTHNITPGLGGILPANDIWMHRIIGGSGNPTAGGHTFLDAETMLAVERANERALGGRTDWTGAEIQAASWVAIKGRDLFAKKKGRWTMEQALAEATKSYPDYFPKHTYRSTMESTPGAASGHMPAVARGTYAEKEAYAAAADPWVQEGQDIAARAGGLDLQTGGGPMVGSYKGELSPGEYSETLVGFGSAPRRLGDSERSALEKVEAFRAVVDGQESGAGHYTMPEGLPGIKASEIQGIEALTERALTPAEMTKFETVASRNGALEWSSNTGPRAIAQFDGPVSRATESSIREALQEAGLPLRTLRRAKHDSVLQDFSDEWAQGEGAVTRKLLEIMSGPDAPLVAQRMESDAAVKQAVLSRLTRDAELAAKHIPGYEVNHALQNFRRIWADSGFDGLRRALESGELLPSVFLPAIGLGVAMSLSGEEGPSL